MKGIRSVYCTYTYHKATAAKAAQK
jgi:hypothetical protein